MTIVLEPFSEALEDVSRGNPKLHQSEFLDSGAMPVVDQGQKYIAGYTDDDSLRCRIEGPVVLFGDHTRAIKYVDFPFVIGADGVKVLRVRPGWDTKYVYHYLRSVDVPRAGYSRHFKYLKEIQVPRPPLEEQRRIAAILDHADALRAKRRQVLAHLDSLTQSIFHDMFGATSAEMPTRVTLGEVVIQLDSGVSPKCESRPAGTDEVGVLKLGAVTYGVFRPWENKAYIEGALSPQHEVQPGDVLMTRKNTRELVGAVALVDDVRPGLYLPDLIYRLHLDPQQVDRTYFQSLMMSPEKRSEVKRLASGSAGSMPNISKARLRRMYLDLAPLKQQQEFARRLARVGLCRAKATSALAAADELFASLQSRAFRGEL